MTIDPTIVYADCHRCGGSGMIRWNRSSINDPQFEEDAPCPACNGFGAEVVGVVGAFEAVQA